MSRFHLAAAAAILMLALPAAGQAEDFSGRYIMEGRGDAANDSA